MISPEERALCTQAVQSAFSHLEARDVAALRRDLAELRDIFVYSDYPFWKRWKQAKPRIVRLLFASLPLEEFLKTYPGRNFPRFEFWSALDELADEIPVPQLQILCERFGFPHPKTAPQSGERLAGAPDVEITAWLRAWVENYVGRERDGMARDSYVWINPLSNALRILARRRDATEIAAALLRQHRFGSATGEVNRALLDGLGDQNSADSRRVLLELGAEATLGDLRLLLLAVIAQFAPHQALEWALLDLERATDTATIEAILRWLWHQSAALQEAARAVTPQVDSSGWNPVSRATLADVWAQKYPFWPLVTSRQTRLILRVGRHLHRWRELDLGCLPLLLGFPILGAAWLKFLNHCLGLPAYSLRWMEHSSGLAWTDLILLLLVWPLFAGGQIWQGPHGMESVRENWESALAFYGATLAFLLGTALVRVAPLHLF